jgi:hypothetical protein
MNRNKLKPCALALLLLGGIQQVQAQPQPVNVTTSAVPFLRISPDARAGGMGDLGLATSPDAGSVFYNLAKTPFAAKKTSIGVTYSPWLKEVTDGAYLLSAGGYHQLDATQSVGVSLRYFNMGDLPVSDYNGQRLMTAQPRELAFDAGYARKLTENLGLSVALRYINSKLATGNANGTNYKAASTLAGDISLFYNATDTLTGGWSAGLSLRNLGSKIGYTDNSNEKDFLPANLGLGVTYTAVLSENNSLTLGTDYNKLLTPKAPQDVSGLADYYKKGAVDGWFSSFSNNVYSLSLGIEYSYRRSFSLRAGYIVVPESAGGNGGFTAGTGLRIAHIATLNFSYFAGSGSNGVKNPLSNTLRFGVVFDLK